MGESNNRIATCFKALKSEGRRALITYVVNGDPSESVTLAAMKQFVDDGVDIIELGVPFSDPMAEGPVIQKAHERALAHNTSLTGTLALVKRFRESNQTTPVILMGYANPVERMGYEVFVGKAADAGVDGLLTVDLPPEEAGELNALLQSKNIENIFLLAPTSTDERIKKVVGMAGGFIYYVSLKGVTGASHLDVGSVKNKVDYIRSKTELPVVAGFGIKDAESAGAIGAIADGVVVGSALVSAMAEGGSEAKILQALKDKIVPMRKALDGIKS